MTAATDAPVEERHRRAAALAWASVPGLGWGMANINAEVADAYREAISKALANAERDGRASRDAEVAELEAYKRAWERLENVATSAPPLMATTSYAIAVSMCSILAEELARKGTP